MTTDEKTSCGFATIIGAPNAGKSTLINTIVGEKISIVSSKVQTTRTRVLGIVVEGNAQIIFVDTPGLFKPSGDYFHGFGNLRDVIHLNVCGMSPLPIATRENTSQSHRCNVKA